MKSVKIVFTQETKEIVQQYLDRAAKKHKQLIQKRKKERKVESYSFANH